MSDTPPGGRYSLAALLSVRTLAMGAGIGAVALGVTAAYAWAGGFFSPHALTQTRIIGAFEGANGVHAGFRRNHAKGVCLTGWFDSTGAAAPLSRAVVFAPGRTPVFGRFALAGGMPRTADKPATVRSMALNFTAANGEIWRTGMNDIPVFAVKDARGFYEQLVAAKPDPKTGKPDPAALKAFLAAHPETVKAMALIKAAPLSSGFADARYNSLNAFYFVNAAGKKTPVRWAMVPEDRMVAASKTPPADKNYLFAALNDRLQKGAVRWHLIVTIGAPGDPTDDATKPWPKSRPTIDAGVLTVQAVAGEASGNCRDTNFDPTMLPAGITVSNDPLLSARSAAYSVSFTHRAGEPKSPSAYHPHGA